MLAKSAAASPPETGANGKHTVVDEKARRVPVAVSPAVTPAGPIEPEASSLAPLAILYDQTNNPSTNGANSQNFEAVYDAYDDQGADDFVVPASGWVVTTVVTPGVYFNGPGPVASVHVTFYADAAGLPGAIVPGCDYPAVVPAGAATGSFTTTLAPPCTLPAGAKWVSVQANMNFAGGGQWGWTMRTVQSFNASVWRNPGGGFGTGCATYMPRVGCGVGTDPDQVFRLEGSIAGCTVDADCQDGTLCNGAETCSAGSCVPGTPVNCDDGLFCTIDSCAPATGLCTNAPNPCSDGDPCTLDSCTEAGGCAHGAPSCIQFCNTAATSIPSSGPSTPYPSTIAVTGLGSVASLGSVQLQGISHTFPDDIDMLLVGPGGQNAIIMSDVGGGSAVVGVSLTLRDGAAASLPDAGPLVTGTFKPTNVGAGDLFPAPAPVPSGGSALAAFDGTNPNGTWSLYIQDDSAGDSGTLTSWCINVAVSACTVDADCSDGNLCNGVERCVNNTCTPGTPVDCDDHQFCTIDGCTPATGQCTHTPNPCSDNDSCTADTCDNTTLCSHTNACVQYCNTNSTIINDALPASPYPSSINISGLGTLLTLGSVQLQGLTHTFTDDIDILLVGPAGQNAIIMSDVGGGAPGANGINLTLDDSAVAPIPDNGPLVSGAFRPTNSGAGDAFPPPAPAPSGGSALSVFAGTDPNGAWSLYVVDDAGADTGTLAAWCLNLRIQCLAPTEVGDSVEIGKDELGVAHLLWPDTPGPFNVYRGSHTGNVWAYNHTCFGDVPDGNMASDPTIPPHGVSFYYLVSRTNDCGESGLGRASNGNPRPNTSPCPPGVGGRFFNDTVDAANDPLAAGCHWRYTDAACSSAPAFFAADACLSKTKLAEWTNQVCHAPQQDVVGWDCRALCPVGRGRCVTVPNVCGAGLASAFCQCF